MKVAREDIVKAARELFRQYGYAGASMQALATNVGLKKASLYMRFENKEALVPEVMSLTLAETFDDPALENPDWRIAYAAALQGISSGLIESKRCVGLHLAYGVTDETPEAREAVRDFFLGSRKRLQDILAIGVGAELAEQMATDALLRLEGATLWLATMGDQAPMNRAVKALIAEAEAATVNAGS
ncbi:helix-turn-helix domain-containing protein [Phyllobacterium sp. SB3]|uniref:TetR/AcrR family transcriptional regulator n=1 Tax=Phyllobacterium sp. SB3 TaxID=3156073 RepID=UPI0032AE9B60